MTDRALIQCEAMAIRLSLMRGVWVVPCDVCESVLDALDVCRTYAEVNSIRCWLVTFGV